MSDGKHPISKLIHSNSDKHLEGAPIANSGPVFASTYYLSGMPGAGTNEYGRYHQPNWVSLEEKLGALEGGEVAVFPSGMAAISTVLMVNLLPGDTLMLPNDGYYLARGFFKRFMEPMGIKLRLCATKDLADTDFTGCKLVMVESPANPMLDICDIRDVAMKVHAAGGLLAVDNTTASVLGQTPLKLGADYSVASDTKALNGHSDVVFGHVAAKDVTLITAIKEWRKLAGNIPGPMETWLVERGLQTLDVRLERQNKNALKIARYLKDHPKVQMIRYPGLESDPSHALATKQMTHFGTIISFDLGEQSAAEQFMARLNLIANATSFGGTHTMAERRKRWGTDDIGEGVIRLSVGIEHIDDLLSDIEHALVFYDHNIGEKR